MKNDIIYYKFSKEENWCIDEIKAAIDRFGLNKDKCLEWSTFRFTEERRAIFEKIWKMLYA